MSHLINPFIQGGATSPALLTIIQSLGLDTNLELCEDAGDINSWPGSGQTWNDVAGNNVDFNRGLTSSVEAGNDPEFKGAAGGLSINEKWSLHDGGSDHIFTLAGAVPAFIQAWHENNADFTLFAIFHLASTAGGTNCIIDTGGLYERRGIDWALPPLDDLRIRVRTDAGADVLTDQSFLTVTNDAWSVAAVSLAEAAGAAGSFHFLNGSFDAFDGTYSTPDTGAPFSSISMGERDDMLGVGDWQGDNNFLTCFAAWSESLTQAQITSIWNQIRKRFSI